MIPETDVTSQRLFELSSFLFYLGTLHLSGNLRQRQECTLGILRQVYPGYLVQLSFSQLASSTCSRTSSNNMFLLHRLEGFKLPGNKLVEIEIEETRRERCVCDHIDPCCMSYVISVSLSNKNLVSCLPSTQLVPMMVPQIRRGGIGED